ncbi:hypothetical protein ACRRTK_011561 [Alexandromys fortis]
MTQRQLHHQQPTLARAGSQKMETQSTLYSQKGAQQFGDHLFQPAQSPDCLWEHKTLNKIQGW